jgi:hypothetical protein
VIQAWIAGYDQVEPEPEIGAKAAPKAGCTGTSVAAHNAVSAATGTAISRADVLRPVNTTPPSERHTMPLFRGDLNRCDVAHVWHRAIILCARYEMRAASRGDR